MVTNNLLICLHQIALTAHVIMVYEQNECVSYWNGVWRLHYNTFICHILLLRSAKEFSCLFFSSPRPSTSSEDFCIKAITVCNENAFDGMMSLFRETPSLQ